MLDKTQDARKKTWLLMVQPQELCGHISSHCPHKSHGALQRDSGGHCTHSSFVSQLENLKLKKPWSFHVSHKYACPNFVLHTGIIFITLVKKSDLCLPEDRYSCNFHGCYTKILTWLSRQEVKNIWQLMKNYLQRGSTFTFKIWLELILKDPLRIFDTNTDLGWVVLEDC